MRVGNNSRDLCNQSSIGDSDYQFELSDVLRRCIRFANANIRFETHNTVCRGLENPVLKPFMLDLDNLCEKKKQSLKSAALIF